MAQSGGPCGLLLPPDSLGTVRCLAKHRRRARLDTLRYGADVLSKLPNATVYIEAGASDWEPSWLMAKKLRYVGVAKVRGFMLNVTHFDWTANNISFGRELSRRLGGKHLVINTSQNGRGPVHYRHWLNRRHGAFRRINVWCHPLKRGMGPAPTTRTAAPEVLDAYLYIGRPGLSDGGCNGGPLPIGSWFEKRGLMFAKTPRSGSGPRRAHATGTTATSHRRTSRAISVSPSGPPAKTDRTPGLLPFGAFDHGGCGPGGVASRHTEKVSTRRAQGPMM